MAGKYTKTVSETDQMIELLSENLDTLSEEELLAECAEDFGSIDVMAKMFDDAVTKATAQESPPVTRTEPSSGLGTIEYSVQAPETTKAFSDPAVRAAWTLGPVSDTQPKRRPYNASGSLGEYGVFPECDAAPAAMRKEGEP